MPIRNPYTNKDTICNGQADIYRTFTFGKTLSLVSTCSTESYCRRQLSS